MSNFSKVFRLGITDEQLNSFIDAVVDNLDKENMNKVLSKLDDDIQRVYEEALNPVQNKQVLSINKFETKIYKLLSGLDNYISELGDEDGDYFGSEHHWECPEFDSYQFSDDIETVFENLLPLLDKAYKYETIEEDYFISLIEEIEDNINMYPEWSGSEYSDWSIEINGAEVILKWMWLHKNSISDFLDKAMKCFNSNNIVSSFTPEFISELSDNNKKEIYNGIAKRKNNDNWKDSLKDTKHFLHNIYHIVSEIGDNEGFIKNSIANINEKWYYGIDVYEYYLSNNDYQNSEKYIRQTISEFYRQSGYGSINLNIEQTILALHRDDTDERIDEAFENWLEVLEKLEDNQKYKLVMVQYQTYLNPRDYIKLLDVVMKNKTQFYDNYISEIKLSFINKISSATKDSWLGYLIDFAIDKNENIFIDKTTQWLLSDFSHGFDYELLMILTNDLSSSLKSLKKHPILYKHIENNNSTKIDSLRKKLLIEVNAKELENSILKAWQSNIEKFIPSPNDVHKARYESHAKWLAIAKELNLNTYKKVYSDWQINYFRRINLWRELSQYGINKK